jgi:hypothetical protein
MEAQAIRNESADSASAAAFRQERAGLFMSKCRAGGFGTQ